MVLVVVVMVMVMVMVVFCGDDFCRCRGGSGRSVAGHEGGRCPGVAVVGIAKGSSCHQEINKVYYIFYGIILRNSEFISVQSKY